MLHLSMDVLISNSNVLLSVPVCNGIIAIKKSQYGLMIHKNILLFNRKIVYVFMCFHSIMQRLQVCMVLLRVVLQSGYIFAEDLNVINKKHKWNCS